MAETKIKAGQFSGIVGHGTDGYFLMTNGDGTMAWAEGGATGPSVTSVSYPGDDTAADPAGGQTVVLTGTGFAASGMTVSIGGTTAPSVAHDSNTQLTITTPAKAAGDYDIVVTNTVTGASGTFVNGISYNGIPTWTTAAGSLGTFESETTISTITLQATEPDGGTITFNITNGALPTGLSLTGANIDGTTTAESSTTLYSFTIEAIDDENQATPRNFSITVNASAITPSENFTINTYTGNGSTQSIEGKIGTAADFNGSSSKIDFSSYQVPTTNVSFSFWFRSNNTPSSAATAEVLYNHFNGAQSYGVQIGSTTIGSYALGAGGSPDYLTYSMSADTLWHHVVVTMGSTNGHVLYIDGSPVATDAALTSYYGGGTGTNNIGSSGSSKWFDGQIDQFRIFEKELSSSEVTTLYGENNASLFKSTTDIFGDGSAVALYEFEEGANDTGGVSGYIGSGGIFNGSSSKIEVSNPVIPNGASSISFWYNPEGSTGTEYILGQGVATASKGITVYWYNQSFGALVAKGTSSLAGSATGSTTYSTTTWHNVVFTWDGTSSSNAFKVYVNGSLLVEGTSDTSSSSIGTYTNFAIGGLQGGTFASGSIDQVRVFNKALSSSEVTTVYNETKNTVNTLQVLGDASCLATYRLNGDALDLSGNYNGTESNIDYQTGSHFAYNIYENKARTFSHKTSDLSLDTGTITPSGINANRDNGFSIIKWTGNGVSGSKIPHGLSNPPEIIITKGLTNPTSWVVGIGGISGFGVNDYLTITTATKNSSSTFYQAYEKDIFQVGVSSANEMNKNSSNEYISYAWRSVPGFSKIGTYVGNGGTNTITTGFEPRFLMIKRTDVSGYNWVIYDNIRDTANPRNIYLNPNTNDAESGPDTSVSVNFVSDGFEIPSTSSWAGINASGATIIYMAFAHR